VEDFEESADRFLRTAQHPTLGRGYLQCAYVPMVELLTYLAANGFATFIASGGGWARLHAAHQPGHVRHPPSGSSAASPLSPTPATSVGAPSPTSPRADYLDDGPEKSIRIWNRTGRRPVLAAGNSNDDVPMLEFTHHADKPTLRLLVLHDDPEREFDYTGGSEQALRRAEADGWTVVSIRKDWTTVF
jgi:hypothetical protein